MVATRKPAVRRSKVARAATAARASETPVAPPVGWPERTKHLTREESEKVTELWEKEKAVRNDRNPDKHHFFDLLYLGFLGHIEHRARVEGELHELKRMLDKSADLMMDIVEKSQGHASAK